MGVNQIERINILPAYLGVEVKASLGETTGLEHVLKRQGHSELFCMKLIASSRFNSGMLGGLPVLIHGRSVAAAKNIAIRLAEGVPVTHGNAQMPAVSGLAIYRLIASAELNDIDPEAYLRFVIGRIADHPVNRLDGLLLIRSER